MRVSHPITTVQYALLAEADRAVREATDRRHALCQMVLAQYGHARGQVVQLTEDGLIVDHPEDAPDGE